MNPNTTTDQPATPASPPPRNTMNGKPVFEIDARTVINFKSAFAHKLLCDGLTFSAGSACNYRCSFCYVGDMAQKFPGLSIKGQKHEDIVVRRKNAPELARAQLVHANGRARFPEPTDTRVIYASPLVDVAGNIELANETVAICRLILALTHWQIRLLSKSNLLPRIARDLEAHPELRARERVIYGVSTGTLQNSLARAFEEGTPLVSKRLESLHWLQDNGYRTFGMICPSLPQTDYAAFAANMRDAIRANRCEHVWAEVINVRGDSFIRTHRALAAEHPADAELLRVVMNDKEKWEAYARATFLAHAEVYKGQTVTPFAGVSPTPSSAGGHERGENTGQTPGAQQGATAKLRFLQYVTADSSAWWATEIPRGAILL